MRTKQSFIKNKNLRFLVKLFISCFLVWMLLDNIDLHLIWKTIRNYPMRLFFAAFALMMINSIVGALSLYVLYRRENISRIWLVTIKSCFYSLILPGQLLGESTKVLMLSPKKEDLTKRVSAVLLDKVLNIIALSWLGVIGIFRSSGYYSKGMRMIFAVAASGVSVLLVAGMSRFICSVAGRAVQMMREGRLKSTAEKCCEIWSVYVRDKSAVLISTGFGLIYHLIIDFMYCILAYGLSIPLSFWDFCWINALLTLILLMPVSVGGLGVREASMVGLLGLFGVRQDVAFSLSALMMLLQLLRAGIGGIFVLCQKEK